MNGLSCDATFMLRYPYLFAAIMLVFIPCMTYVIKLLRDALFEVMRKEDAD